MTETPRPDPWEKVDGYYGWLVIEGSGRDAAEPVYLKSAVDAARAADAAEIATLRATGDQQAETIRQLQNEVDSQASRLRYEAGENAQLRSNLATLTQERDEARANHIDANERNMASVRELEAADARCATLTAALEQVYSAFRESLLEESYPIADDLARAALAAAPQGDTSCS